MIQARFQGQLKSECTPRASVLRNRKMEFTSHACRQPVFYPAEDSQKAREWPGGVEDPRIVEAPDGSYVLTYTQWNRQTYTIGVATSPDLIHWTKHGPALAKLDLTPTSCTNPAAL
jgi:predicted GH43/DUF377 family glycosyl hydrolase